MFGLWCDLLCFGAVPHRPLEFNFEGWDSLNASICFIGFGKKLISQGSEIWSSRPQAQANPAKRVFRHPGDFENLQHHPEPPGTGRPEYTGQGRASSFQMTSSVAPTSEEFANSAPPPSDHAQGFNIPFGQP